MSGCLRLEIDDEDDDMLDNGFWRWFFVRILLLLLLLLIIVIAAWHIFEVFDIWGGVMQTKIAQGTMYT